MQGKSARLFRSAASPILAAVTLGLAVPGAAEQKAPAAVDRMQQPGPEAVRLAARSGEWDATITIWPAHEVARQEWTRADGSGERWLAIQFDYRRRAASGPPGKDAQDQ